MISLVEIPVERVEAPLLEMFDVLFPNRPNEELDTRETGEVPVDKTLVVGDVGLVPPVEIARPDETYDVLLMA